MAWHGLPGIAIMSPLRHHGVFEPKDTFVVAASETYPEAEIPYLALMCLQNGIDLSESNGAFW